MTSAEEALTFLFTDIEGSTQLWERYRSLMPDVLARHRGVGPDVHGGGL